MTKIAYEHHHTVEDFTLHTITTYTFNAQGEVESVESDSWGNNGYASYHKDTHGFSDYQRALTPESLLEDAKSLDARSV